MTAEATNSTFFLTVWLECIHKGIAVPIVYFINEAPNSNAYWPNFWNENEFSCTLSGTDHSWRDSTYRIPSHTY
jgi:hypothetical protein